MARIMRENPTQKLTPFSPVDGPSLYCSTQFSFALCFSQGVIHCPKEGKWPRVISQDPIRFNRASNHYPDFLMSFSGFSCFMVSYIM